MYIYLQVNRLNIIQVWLAIQGQAGAKVHIIQHCMTFSFVNPKWFLKTKYLPGGCLQSLNKEMSAAVSRSVCSESGFSVYKNIQGFFDSNIALNFFFFFFCMISKIILMIVMSLLFLQREIHWIFPSGVQLFFLCWYHLSNWKRRTRRSVWRKEVVQTKLLTDVWSDIFILW